MSNIKDPRSGQTFVVPDAVAADYVRERPVDVELEPATRSVAKKATKQRSRRKVE